MNPLLAGLLAMSIVMDGLLIYLAFRWRNRNDHDAP